MIQSVLRILLCYEANKVYLMLRCVNESDNLTFLKY